MNLRGGHGVSFDNLAFSPRERQPPARWEDVSLEESPQDSGNSPSGLSDSGRVIFTLGPSISIRYSDGLDILPQSQSSSAPLLDSLRDRSSDFFPRNDDDDRENSQGYHFLYSSYFSRPRFFSGIRNRLQGIFCTGPPSVPSFSTSPYLDLEVPRSEPSGDLIDLSEIFPRTDSATSTALTPSTNSVAKKRIALQGETMTSLLRSEQMELVELIIPKENAYECVAEVGRAGVVQFNDLNQSKNIFQRYFIRDTRRCEEVVRKLRYLRQQVADCVPPVKMEPPATDIENAAIPTSQEIHQLNTRLDEQEKDLTLFNQNFKKLQKNLNEMMEFRAVLEKVETFFEIHVQEEALCEIEAAEALERQETFQKSFSSGKYPGMNVPLTPLLTEAEKGDNAWFIAGVIPADKMRAFERILWRACRRTAFVRISDDRFTFEDPETQAKVEKCVFIVFFKGQQLKMIIDKVCDGFNARQYPCPKTSQERQTALFDVVSRIHDHTVIIDSTKKHRFDILSAIATDLPAWCQKVQIHKSIFHTLNMCTVDTNGFLQAECWVPVTERERVQQALQVGFKATGSEVPPVLNVLDTNATPPTFNRTNKFTQVFQSIVDSYGVASYREVNPAPFTIISFPFLFAVMFGDAAHGVILFLAGLFFIMKEKVIQEKRIRDEIFNTFFGGRYIIILMGLFSIYTGFIYNDAFAKSFNLFDSRWKNPLNQSDLYPNSTNERGAMNPNTLLMLDPIDAYQTEDGPYPFGVDPIWNIAENRLSFINSMKMKMSVILGVAQMTFGVLLSLLNHRYFKSSIDIWTNFVPQVIFLSCIFIYLCVQIILKWIFFTAEPGVVFGQEYPGAFCAPSLLIGLINTFMFKPRAQGFMLEDGTHHPVCHLNQWYPNQAQIEAVLIGVSLACIPVMLFGKPIATWLSMRKKHSSKSPEDAILLENGKSSAGEKDHGSLGDVIVHQAIHTIEFVLGCVSHTASYLRLWALSLAHAQLSEVLWHMILIRGMTAFDGYPIPAAIATFFIFAIFAILTFAILVMMEGLSAFLHALRLHWVEFQSKFYQGLGNVFHPYSLRDAVEAADQQIEAVDDNL